MVHRSLWMVFGILAITSATPAAPASNVAAQRARFQELRQAVLSEDPATCGAAARELKEMGLTVRKATIDAIREALARDRVIIEKASAAASGAAKVKPVEDELQALRKSARENIAKLEKNETLKIAHENYKRLDQLTSTLAPVYNARSAIADALARRAELMPIYRELAPANDNSFPKGLEDKLVASAQKALGMTIAQVLAMPTADKSPPSDPAERALWFHRVCRQIERYNASIAQVADKGEFDNIVAVNTYREMLGILPFEMDPRLQQSARRHSKEMVELNYFAHESPTAGSKSFADREKNAGYDGAMGENIARGPSAGDRAFWMWFDSPGHHKNMANPDGSAIGVGRWRSTWTQNMGRGKRLMLLTPAERVKIEIKGTILPPESPVER